MFVGKTLPGGFSAPDCQALIAFCRSGRHESHGARGESGSPRQMARRRPVSASSWVRNLESFTREPRRRRMIGSRQSRFLFTADLPRGFPARCPDHHRRLDCAPPVPFSSSSQIVTFKMMHDFWLPFVHVWSREAASVSRRACNQSGQRHRRRPSFFYSFLYPPPTCQTTTHGKLITAAIWENSPIVSGMKYG